MTTPNQYIEEAVKKVDDEFTLYEGNTASGKMIKCDPVYLKSHLTSSLNGLLELIEKEIEGRRIATDRFDPREGLISSDHYGYNSALSDLSTWLKSIK